MRGIDADDVAPPGVAPAEVEYYFECGEPGYTGVWPAGFSSGWRTVALYPDENERRTYTVPISQYGGQAYEFRVWARDASDNQNTTLPSDWYPAIDRLPP